jgi:hypothetical protein
MLSSGLRKESPSHSARGPWITTDANPTSEVSTARLDPRRVIERSESAIGRTVDAYRLKNFAAEIDACNGHRWWPKGERAPGLADKRFVSTYLYTAVQPTTECPTTVLSRTHGCNRMITL